MSRDFPKEDLQMAKTRMKVLIITSDQGNGDLNTEESSHTVRMTHFKNSARSSVSEFIVKKDEDSSSIVSGILI